MKLNKNLICLVLMLVIFSFFVSAGDDAPPTLPVQYWGAVTYDGLPAADGLAVTAEVDGVDYAQATVTSGGKYDVMVVGGDRYLTNESDPTCADAVAAGRACVPCDPGTPGDCIEGPQDGEFIILKVDDHIMKPYTSWAEGSSLNLDGTAITQVSIPLTTGWNLLSLPLIPVDNSLSNVLSSCSGDYDVVWTTTSGDVWKSSIQFFNPLNTIEYDKSYLIYMNSDCTLTVSGYAQYKTNVAVTFGWNLIGYPSIETAPLATILSPINYAVVWTTTSGDVWKSSIQFFNPLVNLESGGGYESYINTGGDYNVTY